MSAATATQTQGPPGDTKTAQSTVPVTSLVKDGGPRVDTSRFPPTQAPPEVTRPLDSVTDYFSIPLDRIEPSRTNPRKNFQGPEFDELVGSVKRHGVVSPILVRPLTPAQASQGTENYQIVAGERRYRAARKVGLKTIPAIVRELTDERALELQLVENLQRQDITALEEAQGYVQLIDAMAKEQAKRPRPELVAEVARKVGKSTRYVYQRMALIKLAPEVKKAIGEGVIPVSHGDEISRLQPADQKKALEFCLNEPKCFGSGSTKRETAPSFRELKKYLHEDVLIDLSRAPFSVVDDKLLPAAGSCVACPKRAGNMLSFKDTGTKNDTCTDSVCYGQKKLALLHVNVAAEGNQNGYAPAFVAKREGQEPVPISVEYFRDPKKKQPGVLYANGYEDHGYRGSRPSQYGEVRKGDCLDTKLGVFVDGAEMGKSRWICVGKSCKFHGPPFATSSGGMNDAAARRAQRVQKHYRAELLHAIAAKASKLKREDWQQIAEQMFDLLGHYGREPIRSVLGWDKNSDPPAMRKKFAAMEESELQTHLLLFSLANNLNPQIGYSSKPTELLECAARHGVDPEPLLTAAKAKFAPKNKADKSAKVKKAPAKKPAPKAAKKIANKAAKKTAKKTSRR